MAHVFDYLCYMCLRAVSGRLPIQGAQPLLRRDFHCFIVAGADLCFPIFLSGEPLLLSVSPDVGSHPDGFLDMHIIIQTLAANRRLRVEPFNR
jgi:hypothetical protein